MNKFGMVVMSLVPAVALAQPAKQPAPPAGGAPAGKAAPGAGAPAQPKADPKAQIAPPVPPAPPAAPPEVKATVDAFKGNWRFDTTMTATGMPGMDKPFANKMTFNCKEVAGKTAVACEQKTKTPMGPYEGSHLITYDPYTKVVHFISITNQHEVRDRTCKWSGLELKCSASKSGMGPGGDEITEELTVTWEADKKCTTNDAACLPKAKAGSFKAVNKLKSGATMTFEGKGKR